MQVALIGYGVENQATYRYFAAQGIYPTICDANPAVALPEGATSQLGDDYLDNLDHFDLIVRTVGMHPRIITEKNPNIGSKITTAVNLFFEACRTPIIGITGTKGKGTTSTLTHKILTAAGKTTVLAGNIGLPMLDVLEEANRSDYVVLELSSFQLSDLRYSPATAVCLMVVPEHLNWHSDFEDYKQAKAHLFAHQTAEDRAVYNAFNAASQEIAASSPATTKRSYGVPSGEEDTYGCAAYVKDDAIFYNGEELLKTNEVALLGRHNLENVCAAIAATWDLIDGNQEAIRSVVRSFTGLEYRLQFIRELDGVKYYNDSFSTTPETAIAALRAFSQPKVVILGGSDKGVPFDELADEVVKNQVKHALCIGDVGPTIATLLQNRGFSAVTTDGLTDMPAIIQRARSIAEPGDVVLLSTGAASFGLFHDYKDRGKQFNAAVQALT